jgi:hypothetical protein
MLNVHHDSWMWINTMKCISILSILRTALEKNKLSITEISHKPGLMTAII